MLSLGSNISRRIAAYPYGGHVFVCNEITGIADVQELFDSALHVIEVGDKAASGCTTITTTDVGGVYGQGSPNVNHTLAENPVAGCVDGVQMFPLGWPNRACFELIPQMLKYALVVTVRLQGAGEFAFTNFANIVTGDGGRASFLDITLNAWNLGGAQSDQLIARIYRDWGYYQANVGVNAPTAQDLFWDTSFPAEMADQKIRQLTILGNIDPALIVNAATANIGGITFRVNYPLTPLGTTWSGTQIANGTTCNVQPAPHPMTGIDHYCDGVIDFELYLYK